jgi:hypothetical protein
MHQLPALFASSIAPSKTQLYEDLVERLFKEMREDRESNRGNSATINRIQRSACRWWIDCLYQGYCCIPTSPVALSLSRNNFSVNGYRKIPQSHNAVMRAVRTTKALGWVRQTMGCNGPDGCRSLSRYAAHGGLLDSFTAMGRVWHAVSPPEREMLIVISQDSRSKKRHVAENEHSNVRKWRDDLHRINCLIGNKPIYLDLPDSDWLEVKPKQASKSGTPAPLCLTQTAMRRMFTRNKFDHGGRFYGGWWQNIPAYMRRHIVIGDQITVECDYSGIALRTLYAREGLNDIPSDPYDIGVSATSFL